jgi:RNA polymerase sigma factor (sigma-70 family)
VTTTAEQTSVGRLVSAAAGGDEQAWADLITRYSPLVVSVINRFTLSRADAADVNQTVWLRLVEHLDRLREPAALPMWLIQTTRHECLRLLRANRQTWLFDPQDDATDSYVSAAGPVTDEDVDTHLIRAERRQALRDAYADLPPRCQQLVGLLLRDPPVSYEEIGEQMGIPVGSVGPTRGRCVHKLRTCPALAACADALRSDREGGIPS